jgi:hypothetical protein
VNRRVLHSVGLATSVLLSSGTAVRAQSPPVSGYLQTVPVWSGPTPVIGTNLKDVSRVRMTADPAFGPISISAAYEHVVTVRRRPTVTGLGIGAVPGGGEWLQLQWTISEATHAVWQHRLDRLHVDWAPAGSLQVSAGRQAVSWGTTLFLTPADPFVPFIPADPFREFRAGVDAVRARFYPGPLSEIDLVVRPTKTPAGEELTALARGLTTWRTWELSGWVGSLYGDPAAAFGAAGSLGAWAVRSEVVVRETEEDAVVRGTFGVDHLTQLNGRDLYLIAEYQRDGLGASTVEGYPEVLASDTFIRGEHQVLGRDETVVQASYQLRPLWSLNGVWIWNLNDHSSLISPSFVYSAGSNASLTGGAFFGVGYDEITSTGALPSEYGLAGKTAYLSLSWFF